MNRYRIGLPRIVIAFVFVLVSCGQARAASPYLKGSPPHYVNQHYGLDVAIPSDVRLCVDDDGIRMSHGFLIPLTEAISCETRNPFDHPLITLLARSGSADAATRTAETLAAEECRGKLRRVEIPALRIPGHKTVTCQGPFVNRNTGAKTVPGQQLEETVLFAWAGDDTGVNLEVTLLTTRARFEADVETLKRVLQGIKFVGSKKN